MAIRINGADSPSKLDSMSSTPHSTYHLADNANLYEIQRDNNFEFIIPDISSITGNEADSEALRLSVASAFIPHFSQSPIPIKRGNNTVYFAGTPEFQSGSLTIRDFIGAKAKDIIDKWQNKSYNVQTEKVGLVGDYKIDAFMVEYSPDYQIVRQWRLHGCWVTGVSGDDYSYDSNNAKSITVNIVYDRAEIDKSSIIED